MCRRDMRRGMMVALAIIAGIFLLSPGLIFAAGVTLISTTPNPTSGPIGTVLNDSAILIGLNPTGTITFNLYGGNDPMCGSAPIFTSAPVTVNGNGTYSTPAGFPAVEAGTYHWIATYSGDPNNAPVSSNCTDEPVAISLPKPPGGGGESPFIAIVGNDKDANPFYLSAKHLQFLYDQLLFSVPTDGEDFLSQMPADQPEICDTAGTVADPDYGPFNDNGEPNAVVRKQDSGWFEWTIRLPMKPNAINICFQCGVLKPNTFRDLGYDAVLECAGYTGERTGTGFCTRDDVWAGKNPIKEGALPQIEAKVSAGPYNSFSPFHLTAYRNPGPYTNNFKDSMTDGVGLQVLNGDAINASVPGTRIMLKSCFDKCINIKLPVQDQKNALGQIEADLEYGDIIYVKMTIPRTNTVDVYCHNQSVRLMGIGESHF